MKVSPMRLPSLPALRVFEAAGRHMSFTRAAEELHVTQAAVSHQIRALEGQIGTPLFHRTTRRLTLTAAGRRLLPAATSAFRGLAEALSEIKREDVVLSITTTSSFGARWLAPRLGRFAELHPGIEVQVRHSKALLDLVQEGLDIAIRWGRGRWGGVDAEFIGPADLVPVASPAYCDMLAPKSRADVARAVLLHDELREDWTEWLMVAGLDAAIARRGAVFDDENVRIQAALEGQGVALISRSLVTADVAAGRLAIVFDLSVDDGYGYYLVTLAGARRSAKIEAFRTFVLDEMARLHGKRG
jgi:LysR family transcriptional regulator, glycine cleavage system transcriptional activator